MVLRNVTIHRRGRCRRSDRLSSVYIQWAQLLWQPQHRCSRLPSVTQASCRAVPPFAAKRALHPLQASWGWRTL